MVEICYGKNQKDVEVSFSDIPILGTGGIIGFASKPLYDKESVLIGRKGTIDTPFYINRPFWTIDTLFYTKVNSQIVLSKYLYYYLSTIGLSRYSEGAAVPSLTTKTLYEIDISLHDKPTQQHIVNTIGTVDDLIEKNIKTIDKLEQLSRLIYLKHKNHRDGNLLLGDCCDIKTGKLDANACSKDGPYPFFTCGQEILRIDNYAFDCEAIIISGNGEISAKYYNGKFNAYQRTYVLSPSKLFYLFMEECKLSIFDLKNNSQGSVIKFITKGMLENIAVVNDEDSIRINRKLCEIYKQVTNIKNKINILKNIKTKLLNKYF